MKEFSRVAPIRASNKVSLSNKSLKLIIRLFGPVGYRRPCAVQLGISALCQ